MKTIAGGNSLTTVGAVRFSPTNAGWATVTTYAQLNAGTNTIKLSYNTAAGSAGGLHVDKVDITRPERRTYDQSARLTQRVDSTGVNTFTYNNRDQLASLTDAVTGTTSADDYKDAAQSCLITYTQATPTSSCTRAGGKNTRSFTYDNYGRTGSDVRHNTSNAETWRADYTYHGDSMVATETIAPAAVAGSGAHSYAYDQAGRLTNWTSPAGSVNYTWDKAGNQSTNGATVFVYDG